MLRASRPLVPCLAFFAAVMLFASLSDGSASAQVDKKDDPKAQNKSDAKKDAADLKKANAKKADPKKDVKKDDPKNDEPKKDEVKEEPKKEPFVPDTPLVELKGHTDWVNAIAFLPDGKTLASVGRDRTIRIWDIESKKEKQVIKDVPTDPKGLAVADGKIVVSTGKWDKEKKAWEGEIRIVDVSGKVVGSFKGHGETIDFLAVSKDGKSLATASEDQTAKLWDIGGGKEIALVKGHGKGVHGVAISPDGKKIATASADGTVRIWSAEGKELAVVKAAEQETKTVDPKSKKEVVSKLPGRPFTRVAFTGDGKRLVAGGLDGEIKIIDVESGKEVGSNKAHELVWAIAISPDGTKIASGGYDQTIKIWDAAGKELKTIKAHLGTVTTLAFSPAGDRIASGSIDGTIRVWQAK